MADRYWVGADASATANWNTTASWSTSSGGSSGASVPGSSDKAVFDGGGSKVGGCVFNAAVSVAEISATSNYTGAGANDGHLDNATNDQSVTVSGNVTLGCKTVSMGDATWTISGNFDNKDVATFTRNASTLVMQTDSTTITSTTGKSIHALTVNGNVATGGVRLEAYGLVTVATGKTLACPYYTLFFAGGMTVHGTVNGTTAPVASVSISVESGGTISGDMFPTAFGTVTISKQSGTWSANVTSSYTSFVIASGTYGGTWSIGNVHGTNAYTVTHGSGTTIFTGNVTYTAAAGALTVANNTNNSNLEFRGNVTLSSGGGLAWTKGTGTITLSGSSDQAVNFLDKTIEDIVINKATTAAKVTLTNGFTADSFTLTKGTLALNATGDTLTTAGNWTIGVDGQVDPTNLDGWTIAVGGNLSLAGTLGDLLDLGASGTWTLTVTGTAAATYTTVGYSDADGGTAIDADDGTCTDEGNNTGWTFAGGAASIIPMVMYVHRQFAN